MALPNDGRCERPQGRVSKLDELVDVDDVVDPDEDAMEIPGNQDVQHLPGCLASSF